MQLNKEIYHIIKENLKDITNEEQSLPQLKQTFKLIIYFNQNSLRLEEILEEDYNFFLEDF